MTEGSTALRASNGLSPLQRRQQRLGWLFLTPALLILAALGFYPFLRTIWLSFTDAARTAPVAIANFAGDTAHEAPWGPIMAAAVLVTLPLVALVLFFQRRLVEGLTAGAVKS